MMPISKAPLHVMHHLQQVNHLLPQPTPCRTAVAFFCDAPLSRKHPPSSLAVPQCINMRGLNAYIGKQSLNPPSACHQSLRAVVHSMLYVHSCQTIHKPQCQFHLTQCLPVCIAGCKNCDNTVVAAFQCGTCTA